MSPADRAWQRIQNVLAEEGVTLEQAIIGRYAEQEAVDRGTMPVLRPRPELQQIAVKMHVEVVEFWREGPATGAQLEFLTRLNAPREPGRIVVEGPRRIL